MSSQEQTPNLSNIQTLETELSLTKAEMEEFKKLPKEEQVKQKDERLAKLQSLHQQFDLAIQDAIKTGNLTEAQRLHDLLEEGVGDLEEQVRETEISGESFTVIPDPEISSAETAIAKLEAEGYYINDYVKVMLTKVNWQEKLKPSYEVVCVSGNDLFKDFNMHSFDEIKAKAKEFGLGLIPQSLAPSIRQNYPKGKLEVSMAMEVILDDTEGIAVFNCDMSGFKPWLNFSGGHGSGRWHPNSRLFFART